MNWRRSKLFKLEALGETSFTALVFMLCWRGVWLYDVGMKAMHTGGPGSPVVWEIEGDLVPLTSPCGPQPSHSGLLDTRARLWPSYTAAVPPTYCLGHWHVVHANTTLIWLGALTVFEWVYVHACAFICIDKCVKTHALTQNANGTYHYLIVITVIL